MAALDGWGGRFLPEVSKSLAHESPMSRTITLKLTEDEAEILLDALESDHEGYIEAMKEARGNGNRADVQTFTEAAARIQAVRERIQKEVGTD